MRHSMPWSPAASAVLQVFAAAILLGHQAHAQKGGNDPYAPVYAECPSDLKVRDASDGLSKEEKDWREKHGENLIPHLHDYLELVDIDDFDVSSYIKKLNSTSVPIVGLSVSGGGTQSGWGGLGIWQAYDARYEPAIKAKTGGLTQLVSYISGLSGGGAVTVALLAANNFTSTEGVRKGSNFSIPYPVGPTGNYTEYFEGIFEAVGGKAELGFPVSAADTLGSFWGVWLPEGYQYANFSDIASGDHAFALGDSPMPILALSEVIPGVSPEIGKIAFPGRNQTNGFNLTSYEVNPYEFGSWAGGRIQAFFPTKWLGTSMSDGSPSNTSQCVLGFDKFTFVQGSTADAFDAWFIDSFYDIPVFAKRDLDTRQSSSKDDIDDIPIPENQENNQLVFTVNETASIFETTFNQSLWATYPNPFENYNDAMKGVDELLLLDGSLTGETNPIRPLIIPSREVDLVIVYEASSDSAVYDWVNGTNLINSAQSAAQGNIPFPKIPTVDTMVTRNFTKQPVFFGCNETDVPLVLYLPNSPWTAYSNYSYMKTSITPSDLDLVLENAFQLATYGNGTIDSDWPTCLACAAIKGSLERVGVDWPDACKKCFSQHCWDGKETDKTVTNEDFNLTPRLRPGLSYEEWNATEWSGLAPVGDESSGDSMKATSSAGSSSPEATSSSTGKMAGLQAQCLATLAVVLAAISFTLH